MTTHLRRQILAAYRECRGFGGTRPPAEISRKRETWESLLETLASRILWDDGDYDMAADFIDEDPEERRAKMALMGIDLDFFVDIAPDPTDEELETIRGQLGELTDRPGVVVEDRAVS